MLVNTDRFGSFHSNAVKLKKVQEFILAGFERVKGLDETDEIKVMTLHSILRQLVGEGMRDGTKKYDQTLELVDELNKYLTTPTDYHVFALVIRDVLLPTNHAVQLVPTREGITFAESYAKALLDTKREQGLSNLIREWDLITEDLCLNMERDIILDLYSDVRSRFKENLSDNEMDIVLTAACQEFERRVSQKRKQRAGEDLESATSFILSYFNFKSAEGPEHFNAGIEVDNWVKDRRGWYIGISLKRTLRERWKQTYTTEIGLLDRYKIKNIIHLINNDRDLSDTKMTEMGSYRHLFFVADESKVLEDFKDHEALGKYIFPMSSLIAKLKTLCER